ncbi:radical SAM protein [Nitrospinaceae bacterium]|nr:radical SAM protein [Nitrospinaceae bacterium]
MPRKFALVHIGNDEQYSLEFVAAEIEKVGHEFRWFDCAENSVIQDVTDYEPDFLCFSPLTTFFTQAVSLSKQLKECLPEAKSVFGGHHPAAMPEVIELDGVDLVITGPVHGTIEKIVSSNKKEVIEGDMISMVDIMPSRDEYFSSIPRIGERHRKMLMSHFGCPYNCSYCSISAVRKRYGPKAYADYYLTRRPIENIIEEAKIFLKYPTLEVDMCDDDLIYGKDVDDFFPEFAKIYKQEIDLPIYGFITPPTIVNASDKVLDTLGSLVDTVAMGVQAARSESLRLFNRQFQTEEMLQKATDRLRAFGIRTKLEVIIGLPVEDPIGDALETIKLTQRVGAGTFGAVFPLMLYPGTELWRVCKEKNIEVEEECNFDWYGGTGSVKFDPETKRKLRNLVKLGTFFIKYNIDERWMRALIEMDLTEASSKLCSENNYLTSLTFRQGDQVEEHFEEILSEMKLVY